jgi:hypothetical protein
MVFCSCAEGGGWRVQRGGARPMAVAASWWRRRDVEDEVEVGEAGEEEAGRVA